MNIDFYYSETCRYCQIINQTVEGIIREKPYICLQQIKYHASIHKNIKYVPTIIVNFKNHELGRCSSALSKSEITRWIEQLEEYIDAYLRN